MKNFGRFKNTLVIVLACIGIALILLFCIAFLLADYDRLAHWYLADGQALYRQDFWHVEFFTHRTKSHGNLFCVAGLLVCILLFFLLFRQRQTQRVNGWGWLKNRPSWPIYFLVMYGIIAWLWGNSLVHPAFDEVFSAVNCASLPAFQISSYYMLPNNHVLFNLLNGIVFHFAIDKVFTGRLISLVCYLGIIIVMFKWLAEQLKSNILAIFITLALVLQFNVWGFSFQARGYELCSLAAWCAFFALNSYSLGNNSEWLNRYVAACVIGYWSIPAFLYFHVACLVFAAIALNSKIRIKFWKAQLVVVLVVFLLYLPALCFSGLDALIANKYVTSQPQTWNELIHSFKNALQGLLAYFSNDFVEGKHVIAWLFFLLPFTLFCFYRRKPAFLLVVFYLSMWSSWVLLAGIMQIFPPERIMSSQLSISLAISFYSLYLLLSVAINKIVIRKLAVAGLALVLAFYLYQADGRNVNYRLYGNDINGTYAKNVIVIGTIPGGKSINFSDECFYLRYLYLKRPGTRDEGATTVPYYYNFYIRTTGEPLPPGYSMYVLRLTAGEYEIYQRPTSMANPRR